MKATEKQEIERIFSQYPNKRAATLPLLTMAQEKFGYISDEACKWVADLVDISAMEVHETASFYTMYSMKPIGKNKVRLCTNVSCMLLGAKDLEKKICKKLDIKKSGDSTKDKKFHFEHVECLGYCEQAPVMQVNKKTYEKIGEEKLENIFNEY